MRRLAAAVAVLLALVALVTVAVSRAAFVDVAATPVVASADAASRWLELVPAGDAAGPCKPHDGLRVTGRNENLVVSIGGIPKGSSAGRQVQCAFLLTAPDAFPEGVDEVVVGVAVEGGLAEVAAEHVTGGGQRDATTLAPGDVRRVRIKVRGPATASGSVVVTVAPRGEEPGFLRYEVPVSVCDTSDLACGAQDGG